ncbi:MAG: PKD domain-containing protein [Chloroflexota bacterium]
MAAFTRIVQVQINKPLQMVFDYVSDLTKHPEWSGGELKVDMTDSSFSETQVSVFQATGPGFEGLSFINCGSFGNPVIFNVQAGSVYYFQGGTAFGLGGDLHLNVYEMPPPANDHFSEATIISSTLPFVDSIETAGTTVEAGEPTPSCGYFGLVGSAWYAFSPTESGSFSVRTSASFYTLTAVYSGDSLAGLTELGCTPFYGGPLSFPAVAGTTYYIQTGAMIPGDLQNGPLQIEFDVAPPPQAGFYYSPSYPSVFDSVQFYDSSSDPGGPGFQSFTWDFGDGTTSTDTYPTHKYAVDSDYTVEHSVTTIDGRTASTSQVVQVRTHDVTVTKIESPASSRTGRTATITVSVVNITAYDETVIVQLYRSVAGGGFEWIGELTAEVPGAGNDRRPTRFTFSYTFSEGDAEIGKVIFRAEAAVANVTDAFPQDNVQLSALTRVKK